MPSLGSFLLRRLQSSSHVKHWMSLWPWNHFKKFLSNWRLVGSLRASLTSARHLLCWAKPGWLPRKFNKLIFGMFLLECITFHICHPFVVHMHSSAKLRAMLVDLSWHKQMPVSHEPPRHFELVQIARQRKTSGQTVVPLRPWDFIFTI